VASGYTQDGSRAKRLQTPQQIIVAALDAYLPLPRRAVGNPHRQAQAGKVMSQASMVLWMQRAPLCSRRYGHVRMAMGDWARTSLAAWAVVINSNPAFLGLRAV
jgi:hypothetical protein